ncbi:MAG: hypothetical protein V2B18_04425, partial [Pseudomonadota bacterium]
MPKPYYALKLYGHTGTDHDVFVRKLAAALGVSEDQADRVVKNVPVVLREGLDKQTAEKLKNDLVSINALCIIEGFGDEPEPAKPDKAPEKDQVKGFDGAPVIKDSEATHSTIKFFLVLGLIAALPIVLMSSYFVSYSHKDTRGHYGSGDEAATRYVKPGAASSQEDVHALAREIQSTEEAVSEQEFQLESRRTDIVSQYHSGNYDEESVRVQRDELNLINEDLKKKRAHLKDLKTRLEA